MSTIAVVSPRQVRPRGQALIGVGTDWAVVAVGLGAGIVAAAQVGKTMVSLPAVSADLGTGLTLAGVLLSAHTYAAAALGALAGGVVARFGARRVLIAALVGIATAGALGALSPTTVTLLLSRALEGLGFMGIVVAAPALVSSASGMRHRNVAMALWGVYMPTGQALAMLVGPSLLAGGGWRRLWWAFTGVMIAYAALAWVVLSRRPLTGTSTHTASGQSAVSRPRRASRSAATTRPAVPAALVFGCYSLQYLAVVGFLPVMYAAHGLSGPVAATLTAVVVAGNIAGNLLAGALLHRGAQPGSLAACALAAMAVSSLGVFGGWAPFPVSVGAAVCFATLGGLLPASVFAAVPRLAPSPEDTGPANGLVVQVSNAASIVGPPLVASLAAASGGWSLSPLVMCTASAAGIGAALVVRRRSVQAEKAAAADGTGSPPERPSDLAA